MGKIEEGFLKAVDEDRVVSIVPEYFEMKQEGVAFIGIFHHSELVQSTKFSGEYKMHYFHTDDGPIKVKFGGATDREIEGMLVTGNVYRVTFVGQQEIAGGQKRNLFEILGEKAGQPEEGVSEDDIPF